MTTCFIKEKVTKQNTVYNPPKEPVQNVCHFCPAGRDSLSTQAKKNR